MADKITFKDIIDLAKQGYKPADVKELFALANAQEPAAATPEDEKAQPKAPERDDADKRQGAAAPGGEDKPVDYKALYLTQQNDLENLKKQLQTLQNANTHSDNSGNAPKDFNKEWEDIARSFM